MDTHKPIKETVVPRQYRFIIDRGFFEISRAQSNLMFMLDKHLNDTDSTEFINSELFNTLLEKCIDARIECWELLNGVYQCLNIKDKDTAQIRWFDKEYQYIITEWKQ